jgi:hypothetical protein
VVPHLFPWLRGEQYGDVWLLSKECFTLGLPPLKQRAYRECIREACRSDRIVRPLMSYALLRR